MTRLPRLGKELINGAENDDNVTNLKTIAHITTKVTEIFIEHKDKNAPVTITFGGVVTKLVRSDHVVHV